MRQHQIGRIIMDINKDSLQFSEILTIRGELSNEDIILLKKISSTYSWFTLSSVFLMKYYRRSDYIYSRIKKDIALNLIACNYYDILSAKNAFLAIPPVVTSDSSEDAIETEQADNDDVVNIFLTKKITKINPNTTVEEIDVDSQYDEALLEEVGEIMIKQEDYFQALDIYRKLILQFPEKKDYFAIIIEDLEDKVSHIR